jgi:hypothetical protein
VSVLWQNERQDFPPLAKKKLARELIAFIAKQFHNTLSG